MGFRLEQDTALYVVCRIEELEGHSVERMYSGVPKVLQQNGGNHYAITLRTCDKTT